MKKMIAAVSLVALAIAAGAPASAQFKGSPKNEKPNNSNFQRLLDSEMLIADPAKASQLYAQGGSVGRCIVNIAGSGSAKLLGGPGSADPGYRSLAKAIGGRFSACSRDSGAVPVQVINYGIAEELVRRGSFASLADRAPSVNVDDATRFQGAASGQVTVDSIARCLSVYSPGLVSKVLTTPVRSDAEAAAMQTLYRSSPECGLAAVPTSVPIPFQRGELAVALLQWTGKP